jgi:hypothetical protein
LEPRPELAQQSEPELASASGLPKLDEQESVPVARSRLVMVQARVEAAVPAQVPCCSVSEPMSRQTGSVRPPAAAASDSDPQACATAIRRSHPRQESAGALALARVLVGLEPAQAASVQQPPGTMSAHQAQRVPEPAGVPARALLPPELESAMTAVLQLQREVSAYSSTPVLAWKARTPQQE